MNKIKRSFALLLALALVFSCASMVLAANETAANAVERASSTCPTCGKALYEGKVYLYYSNGGSYCYHWYQPILACRSCTYKTNNGTRLADSVSHVDRGISATCNGKTQTLVYQCSNCARERTTRVSCPSPGHAAGACPSLAFSLRPELS